VSQVGERAVKQRILEQVSSHREAISLLDGGLGHDSGVLINPLEVSERLLVNTDKSGVSKAFKLGLADGECIGDFAVSHAVSDILASGGRPFAISVAMLIPGDTSIETVDQIMLGILKACHFYDVTLAGGDTKKSDQLALVVTAIGKAPPEDVLFRDTPSPGDLLVVSGELGSMLMGSVVYERNIPVPAETRKILDDALIYQRPPFKLAVEINTARIARACTDISDGLQGACRNMLSSSALGANLKEECLPINPGVKALALGIGLSPVQLSLAGGDWRFLYSVPEENYPALLDIADRIKHKVHCIGKVTQNSGIWVERLDGTRSELSDIENDSFRTGGYFDMLSHPLDPYKQQQ